MSGFLKSASRSTAGRSRPGNVSDCQWPHCDQDPRLGRRGFPDQLAEGSFLGELALVDPNHLRTANAVAMERSVLIGFFKPDLEDILERNPAMGVKILFQLSTVLGRRLLGPPSELRSSSREKAAPMSKPLDWRFRRDLLKFGMFRDRVSAAGILFFGNPALSLPTLLAIILATLFSPWVAWFDAADSLARTRF